MVGEIWCSVHVAYCFKFKAKTGDSGPFSQWYNWVLVQPALLSKVLEHVMHPDPIIADLATTFVTTLYGEHLLHMDTHGRSSR